MPLLVTGKMQKKSDGRQAIKLDKSGSIIFAWDIPGHKAVGCLILQIAF
jgi:hypothetical protein